MKASLDRGFRVPSSDQKRKNLTSKFNEDEYRCFEKIKPDRAVLARVLSGRVQPNFLEI